MTPSPKHYGLTCRLTPVGFDGFLFWLLPRSWFMAHVKRKFLRAEPPRYAEWFELPDGDVWHWVTATNTMEHNERGT